MKILLVSQYFYPENFKIKTSEFIREWEWFYIASVEGMIIITEDGKKILEFTDDYKYHLNSNFEIRPNSKK